MTAIAPRVARWWRRFLGQGEPRATLPSNLARTLARLQLAAGHRVAAPWTGAYRSAFRGTGLEFAGVREYAPGDDSRAVDWRVAARTGRLAVRLYREERDRTVLFVVDAGAAMEAGSGDRTLRDLAAEAVATIGAAAVASGDRVGLLVWADRRVALQPPSRRPDALLAIARTLLTLPPGARDFDTAGALGEARRVLCRRGVLVLVSPLLADPPRGELVAAALRHDLVVVRVWDPDAGRGTSRAAVPARGAGALGTAVAPPFPSPNLLEGLPLTAISLEPASHVPLSIAAAFARRAEAKRA